MASRLVSRLPRPETLGTEGRTPGSPTQWDGREVGAVNAAGRASWTRYQTRVADRSPLRLTALRVEGPGVDASAAPDRRLHTLPLVG